MAKDEPKDIWFFSKLWDTISAWFEIAHSKVWYGFSEMFFGGLGDILEIILKWFQGIEDDIWNRQVTQFKNRGWIDEQTNKELLELKELNFPFNALAFIAVLIGLWSNYIRQMMYVSSADIRRKMFSEGEPEDARVEQIIQAAFTTPENRPKIRQILRNQGLPDSQIDLIFISFYRLYDEGVVRDLFLRGVINDEGRIKRMKELGYTEDRIAEIKETYPIIPGAGDLFHLVAKEAFEPDMIEHYGYDAEFPEEQVKWLSMQGISDYWAHKYWYAHWEVPSIGQGFEMYQRGVIDFPELWDLFRTIEIPPFWREKLTEIAFMPYTRVDVRRMHKIGVIDDDELIRAYQDVGYSPEKALVMADFTVQYNMGAEKDLTRSQILDGYKDDLIDYNEAFNLLIAMKYDETEVDYLLASVDFDKEKETEKLILNNVMKKFQNNLIEETEARDQLGTLLIEGNRIEVLIEKWKINILQNARKPSKADLDKLMLAKIIDDKIYVEQMTKLGYEPKYIGWFMQLAKQK